MKSIKSHFWYNKRQRNGILFLGAFIICLQLFYYYVDFSSTNTEDLNTAELIAFQNQIDSLKSIAIEKRKPKTYPFNPSFITDYKGYKLGMKTHEIDKLLAFRKAGNYINSASQFQQVTGINDSLFRAIKPFFKFPDWLNKKNVNSTKKSAVKITKKDLNLVTAADLKLINGVGNVLSKRIVKFRNSMGGFTNENQLKKVYGLEEDVITKILVFYKLNSLDNKLPIRFKENKIIDLNIATANELKSVNGIGEKLSVRIVKFRTSLGGFLEKDQLNDVYGLKPEVINRLFKKFQIQSKPTIKKLNINEATFKEILHLPYIDYRLTKKIFEYKDEFAEFQDLKELKKIDSFPLDKYERIVLYLTTDY